MAKYKLEKISFAEALHGMMYKEDDYFFVRNYTKVRRIEFKRSTGNILSSVEMQFTEGSIFGLASWSCSDCLDDRLIAAAIIGQDFPDNGAVPTKYFFAKVVKEDWVDQLKSDPGKTAVCLHKGVNQGFIVRSAEQAFSVKKLQDECISAYILRSELEASYQFKGWLNEEE